MSKVLLFLLFSVSVACSQCLYSTSRTEGNTVVVYGECLHQNIIENVYFIDEYSGSIVIKTRDGREYRYFKSNITGYEVVKEPPGSVSQQAKKEE